MLQHGIKRGERLSKSPGLNRKFATVLISVSVVFVGAAALLVVLVFSGYRTSHHDPAPAVATEVADGVVRLPISHVEGGRATFFISRDGPRGGARFFVIEDPPNHFRVALDDCGNCKVKLGYRQEGNSMICNYCDISFPIATVGETQDRCAPIPLRSKTELDHLVVVFGD